ncbi:hypothetical protein AND_007310 [Anopheles darlingi]|uniref:Immunoglobulin domain-containing protein n=1 Tax=Anopheles darlingi TaxID=43151 RepID=W5JCI9_ANODA|nr:hypothetical protein AND_007310 [Anopheles darlingi]
MADDAGSINGHHLHLTSSAEIAQRAVLGLGHQPTSGSYQPPHPHPATGHSTFGAPPPSMAAFPAAAAAGRRQNRTSSSPPPTTRKSPHNEAARRYYPKSKLTTGHLENRHPSKASIRNTKVETQTVVHPSVDHIRIVSWIRRQDFQLLTVGLSTYSSDERFMVAHLRHWGLWALRIKSVRAEDEGIYECQLSVHPVQSVFVELKVVEAEAEIVGAPDLHIDEGSTLRLECKLQRATENPTFVFWYHEQDMVNFDQLNGFSVTPFQPSVAGGHHHHLQHYLPHPVHDQDGLLHSASEEEDEQDQQQQQHQPDFGLTDDEDELQRSLQVDQRIPSSSASASSSLLLASLAAAAFSAHSYQHLESRGLMDLVDSFELQDPAEVPVTDSSSSDAPDVQSHRRPHNHHQHQQRLHHIHHHHQHQHQHHHQHHHFPRGAWPANYTTSPLLYSHILTPAPSVLTIRKVHFKHAGNYTCAPSNARPASITVHVLQDKKPAAMQHANRSQLDDGGKQSRNGASHQLAGPSVMTSVVALLVTAEWLAGHLCSRRFTHR